MMIPRALTILALTLPLSLPATPVFAADPAEAQPTPRALEERLTRLERQMQSQGLLNLLNQMEALKAEVARLRGAQEEQAYQQGVAEKRTKELFSDLDDRLKELESRPVAVSAAPSAPAVRLQAAQSLTQAPAAHAAPPTPATPPALSPAPAAEAPASAPVEGEQKAYDAALALVKSGRYKEAVLAMQAFAKNFPNSGLAANAHYWTGFSYVGMSDFASAAASYQHLIQTYPNSPKTPDAMLSLARAQIQINAAAEATATLEQLIARFPYSNAAVSGKKLLSTQK